MTQLQSVDNAAPAPEVVSRRAKTAWTALVLLLFAGAAWTWLSRQPDGLPALVQAPAPRNGFNAPALKLTGLDGKAYDLAALRGQVVLVNFWATWCPPCREEMPAMEQVQRDQQPNGVIVLAVNQREDAPTIQAYAIPLKLTLPLLLDGDGKVSDLYQVRALPTTYFIDRQGVIRDIAYGALTTSQLIEDRLQPLLASR